MCFTEKKRTEFIVAGDEDLASRSDKQTVTVPVSAIGSLDTLEPTHE